VVHNINSDPAYKTLFLYGAKVHLSLGYLIVEVSISHTIRHTHASTYTL